LHALGSGIARARRRPGESRAGGDHNDRGARGERPRQRRLAEVKCDLDVRLPVDGELLPALLVQRRSGRKRPRAQNQDIRLEDVEYFGRCSFIRCIERQNLGPGDLSGQLPERSFLPRHRKHARAVSYPGFNNPPSYPSATPDHDHVFASQWGHSVPPAARVVTHTDLMCKTGVAAETHRCLTTFFVVSLQYPPETDPERAFGWWSQRAPTGYCKCGITTSIDAVARTRERARENRSPTTSR